MKKSVHYPLVLAIIAALCVAGIDLVYSSVEQRIREADDKKALEAVCCIFKGCDVSQMEKVEGKYEGDEVEWYKCPAGYAVKTSGKGFDGAVTVMVGWDEALEKLNGIYVLSHTETPGLGGNVDLVNSQNTWANVISGTMKDETGKRPDFQEQFRGLAREEAKLKRDGGKIDGLTGATITSVAVVEAVKNSWNILSSLTSQGEAKKE
jgi:RnfABCDGE-type electron transport complex G subunit